MSTKCPLSTTRATFIIRAVSLSELFYVAVWACNESKTFTCAAMGLLGLGVLLYALMLSKRNCLDSGSIRILHQFCRGAWAAWWLNRADLGKCTRQCDENQGNNNTRALSERKKKRRRKKVFFDRKQNCSLVNPAQLLFLKSSDILCMSACLCLSL